MTPDNAFDTASKAMNPRGIKGDPEIVIESMLVKNQYMDFIFEDRSVIRLGVECLTMSDEEFVAEILKEAANR